MISNQSQHPDTTLQITQRSLVDAGFMSVISSAFPYILSKELAQLVKYNAFKRAKCFDALLEFWVLIGGWGDS